jgi:hypothetical protein
VINPTSPGAQKRRTAWGYEAPAPLCLNCSGYRKAHTEPGQPREKVLVKATCKKGGFLVDALGCCDKWSSRANGEKLA